MSGGVGGHAGTKGDRNVLAWALGERWSLWLISNQLINQDLEAANYNQIAIEGGGSLELYFEAKSDIFSYAKANSLGFRAFFKGKKNQMSLGVDIGKVPIYLIGFVPPKVIPLPNFTFGRVF